MRISVDDGSANDFFLFELLEKYRIPGVFYWPLEWYGLARRKGYKPLSYNNAYIIAQRHEIGSHGLTHDLLTRMSEDDARYEIEESKKQLERLFKKKINKFAPARGYITEPLLDFAQKHYGEIRLTRGKNLVHIHPKSGANEGVKWQELADLKLKQGEIELWCHAWELDKYSMWGELEDYIKANTK